MEQDKASVTSALKSIGDAIKREGIRPYAARVKIGPGSAHAAANKSRPERWNLADLMFHAANTGASVTLSPARGGGKPTARAKRSK